MMFVCLSILLGTNHAWAQDEASSQSAFFILSDKSYGSHEQSQVRLEVQDVKVVHDNAGLDITVYQVPKPLEFLKAQSNLHRVNVKAASAQDGVWNSLIAMWDSVMQSARTLWRDMFSDDAREAAVQNTPELKAKQDLYEGHPAAYSPQYKPIEGLDVKSRFRYPLQFGQSLKPSKALIEGANVGDNVGDSELEVAESATEGAEATQKTTEFSNGNVQIPIGQLEPGLYLVEAMLGEQRAITLVFVSDNLMMSKTSSNGMFVWTANRLSGEPSAKTHIQWTDGVGQLGSGMTNEQGWLSLQHASTEQTYVYAQDSAGGVLISENFYYDSEIYNTKLYATTDHPLYRPGDTVKIKVVGREFIDAQRSKALKDAPITINVFDSNGTQVATTNAKFNGMTGADASIELPKTAGSGGYEIQIGYLDELYGAAFRVAEFQKPHFEMNLIVDKNELKTNQDISAALQLRYPDGKPVKNAKVDLTLRAQNLSVIEGDLDYSGEFPVKLTNQQYQSDGDGVVKITLPKATQASRYIVSALATDGAAYRVRHTQELLIERAASTWKVNHPTRFSNPNQGMTFSLSLLNGEAEHKPTRWQWVRLEDQKTEEGRIGGNEFTINFVQSGSYTVNVFAEDGSLLGATSHWVSGPELKVPVGNIEIVWDKASYQVGDTATALVTFPEPVDHALLTLERDKVEQVSLMNHADSWLKTERVAPQQWRVSVPVTEMMAPNMTFSAAYIKNNQFTFSNAGIMVAAPQIAVNVTADKTQYAPGEKVNLTVKTTLNGQPVAANVSLAVVDEMLYVLQPEIAPNIHDFFYHPRRNNVRTHISDSFVGYDLSTNQLGQTPKKAQVQERAIKVLERPKRDEVDTALWAPHLTTDAQGLTTVSFTMPDGLTRWRMTARAMNSDGVVGQSVSHVLSHKDFYIKWTSPTWLRPDDSVVSNIALFNQTKDEQSVELKVSGALTQNEKMTLKPGINFVDVPRKGNQVGETQIQLIRSGQNLDEIHVSLASQPAGWLYTHSAWLRGQNGQYSLNLPIDARNVSLRWLVGSRAGFYQIMDDLIEQPYGCVEQTASRMIPLALAVRTMSKDEPRYANIIQDLYTQRLRLISMAGPEAKFTWWGSPAMADNAFLTTYAYYADWYTARALDVSLPAEHWQLLVDMYSEEGAKYPVWQRALMLDWMRQIGLPVGSLVQGVARDLQNSEYQKYQNLNVHDSWILTENNLQSRDMAWVMTAYLLKATKQTIPNEAAEQVTAAVSRLSAINAPQVRALLHYTGYASLDMDALMSDLGSIGGAYATIDRSLSLTWLERSPMATPTVKVVEPASNTTTEVTKSNSATSGSNSENSGEASTQLTSVTQKTSVMTLPMPWLSSRGTSGVNRFLWPNTQPLPKSVSWAGTDGRLLLNYDSSEPPTPSSALSANLTRHLYLLKPNSDGSFTKSALDEGDVLRSDALYVEELTIDAKKPLNYVLIEAPLPAGAAVESGTWGMKIVGDTDDKGETQANLPAALFQVFTGRYAVPVGEVSGKKTIKHLLRFSQRGTYHLPPARAYNMYRPDMVVTSGDKTSWRVE
ncbi:alpha-2-macroglobulin family protein [Hydromonas duriensis]|uniref:Alpha-2-macroglobulin family protein n=1 Tax=Hydromonas duriensis TaxID=1527608 RepID=A0A4R6Y8R3_9BURK|nr:MG2 domain-containing protein [Hydromonas duriensis]TDR31814.1 hypothetical protein DFR44_10731 [Hydromonas duriensis]